jgi:hypothetical protein
MALLLSTTFPPEQRAKALGIFSGVTGLAAVFEHIKTKALA